jgi:chromosome segregation ATPase
MYARIIPADVKEIGMQSKSIIGWIVVLMVLTTLVACQSTYYAVWEKMGKEMRHLLRDQVEKARDDQAQASEEFKDALTRLKEMYGFDGGDLEKMYNQLSDDYETCQDRAEQIDDRIDNVKQIAKDLFSEWRKEIDEIQNADFRSKSNQKLQATRTRYNRLENAMLTARKRMTPVLTNLHDYVLYLKHNLNAQAIGALKGEAVGIQTDVDRLMLDIRKSIDAADTFLAEFGK